MEPTQPRAAIRLIYGKPGEAEESTASRDFACGLPLGLAASLPRHAGICDTLRRTAQYSVVKELYGDSKSRSPWGDWLAVLTAELRAFSRMRQREGYVKIVLSY